MPKAVLTHVHARPHKQATKEELLFFRLGFIFMAYRVDFWYWEAIEVRLCQCGSVCARARVQHTHSLSHKSGSTASRRFCRLVL